MEGKLSRAAKKLTSSPIQELSHLAQRCNAINLAEGFPDFPAPLHIKNAAVSAINSDLNQYRHVQGICEHLAKLVKEMHGLDIDPLTDVAICCGQTEAFAATIFATIDPGDEVILFDPSYETYQGCITMAGGVPIHVPLDPPQWTLDPSKLLRSITEKTKAIVLNSVTGWRVGWAIAPAFIASAIRNIHIIITDSAPAPFQEAALIAFRSPPEYFESLRRDYQSKRDYIIKLLAGVGFKIQFIPQGSFFLFTELPENCPLSDVEFVKKLILEAGVVAVPGQGFFHTNLSSNETSSANCNYQKRYIRFAFCKSETTLAAVSEKLGKLLDAAGHLTLY